jgi:hypothetical protein
VANPSGGRRAPGAGLPTVGRHRVAASPPSLRVRCGLTPTGPRTLEEGSMRRIKTGLAALALSMLTSVIAVPSASAHMDGLCAAGDYCGYENINYGGGYIDYYYEDDNYTNDRFWLTYNPRNHNGPVVDNRLSSLSNYDAYNPLYLYRHPGFSDRKLTVPAGNPVNDSNLWPCCNDMLSSHNWG